MRTIQLLSVTTLVFVAVCHAAPATLDRAESAAIAPENDKEVIEIINLSNFGQTDRDKRDLNMLRQLFPGLAQIFDRLVQEIISQSFRVIGRVVLQNAGSLTGLLGGGGGGGDGDGESEGRSRVSVSLPTFPPDDDDEDEDEDEADNSNQSSTTATVTTNTLTKRKRDISDAAQNEDNSLSGSESQNSEVRVKFDDQNAAASNNGPSPAEESIDDADADRNKRFLPFGFGVQGGDHNGVAAGGSGNFLFDIIRSTADRAARAAGTVYRMVAGTENLGLGLSATSTSTKTISSAAPSSQLVAGSGSGSGGSEAGDAAANAPAEVDVAKGADGYTEGVPGPITRLFVIANRGIANLIQDLILRLAQTSERIVNFKARLVTALI